MTEGTTPVVIGGQDGWFSGSPTSIIDEVKFSNAAIYDTSGFTPTPFAPLGSDANTVFYFQFEDNTALPPLDHGPLGLATSNGQTDGTNLVEAGNYVAAPEGLPLNDDGPEDLDIFLTFEDDSDVSNWGVYDGVSGYTTVSHDATAGVGGTGALAILDAGGAVFYIKRPITTTIGGDYILNVDVKTSGWDDVATYPLYLSVEGLSAEEPAVTINALAEYTTITVAGTATSGSGYIKIAGTNAYSASNVWLDNLNFDSDADDVIPPTVSMIEAPNDSTVVMVMSEAFDVATAEVLTNYSLDRDIGNPIAVTVEVDTITLALGTKLLLDSLYTVTIDGVEDLEENAMSNYEVEVMYYYTPVPDLFFSEYVEGSSMNKALEIYNPTDEAIDLAGYILGGSANESDGWEYYYDFPDTASTVAAGAVYVIADHDAAAEILAVADWIDDGYAFNRYCDRCVDSIISYGQQIDI